MRAGRAAAGTRRGVGRWITVTSPAAIATSAASTSSRFCAPPTGPTSVLAIRPPAIAPSEAPLPTSPKSRLACPVSNSPPTTLHACTGAMTP